MRCAALAIAVVAVLGAAGCDESEPRPSATPATRAEPPAGARADRGPQLVLTGDGETWIVDVRSGRGRHAVTPELIGGDPPHRVIRRGDRFVLWGDAIYVSDPDRPLRRRSLARAAFFLPSAHPERVWLFDFGADALRFAAAREVTAAGRTTVRAAKPPPGWPERAARSGLLLSPRGPALVLWDPRTRAVVNTLDTRRIGDLGPVHGDTLASCVHPCRALRLTDVRTGAQRRVRAPGRLAFEPYDGAFSSGGGELALPVAAPGSHGARRLALVDLDRLAVEVVAGTRVPQGYVMAEWSRDDRHVFMAGGHRGTAVIADYDRGRERARRLRPTMGAFYDMAAR